MIANYCCEGELCLLTRDGLNARLSLNVTPTVTRKRVLSAMCDRCRFARYIHFTDTCWLWTGTFMGPAKGRTYGMFQLRGVRTGAHRWAYMLWKGDIPQGLDVMHSCDVKACVNPDHLSVGTRSQNLLDGFRNHPGVCAGENNGRAKLDWPRVRAIRAAAASGVSQVELSRRYGVTPSAISLIVRGRKWPEPVAEQGEVAA